MSEAKVTTRPLVVENRDGLPIRADLHLPPGDGPHPLVLVAHGFKGFKDWGFFPWVADRLAEEGIAACRFNFARCGVGDERPTEFTRLDLFEENSITRERADVEDLLAALPDRPEFAETRRESCGLLGHSRGGAVAILAAAEQEEIRSLVTWSAVADWGRSFPPEVLGKWKEAGRYEIANARTGQQMPLGMELWRDLAERTDEIDVLAAEERLSVPHLIVHGEADESVDPEQARMIHRASAGKAAIEIVPGAGHTFGAVHPFEGPTEVLARALRATALHFRVTL